MIARKFALGVLIFGATFAGRAVGADLTLPVGGKVTIELIASDAAFSNTLSLASPGAASAASGCQVDATSFAGLKLVSEKNSQHGCRITLDADPGTPGIQSFAASTTLRFNLCAQEDANPATCEHVWSSAAALNGDGNFDHVSTTAIHPVEFPNRIFQLAWEDLPNGGDNDFDDLVVVVRVDVDTDEDGLWDDWEQFGVDTNGDGSVDVDLPGLGANAQRKDLFLEIDCLVSDVNGNGTLEATDHTHCPAQAGIAAVVRSFANAPVSNPDGSTGIQLGVDVGPLYGAGTVVTVAGTRPGSVSGSYGDLGGGNQIAEAGNTIVDWDGAAGNAATNFYTLKQANFDPDGVFVFRYALFAHQTNARSAANDCTSGWAEGAPGNDFLVTLGGVNAGGNSCWGADANGFSVGTQNQQSGTLMHELGHVLGFRHGGGDGVNNKPNYYSVMNYSWQMCSVPASPTAGLLPGGCDYSPMLVPPLNETSLDECVGTDAGLGFGRVNWDRDGLFEGVTVCVPPNNQNVSADINGDNGCVGPGPDGVLNTPAAGDDVVAGAQILDGPNFTCDTTTSGDDAQLKTVGTAQPNPLNGYNDWANLVYDFRTNGSFVNGVASPVAEELDPQLLQRSQATMLAVMLPLVTLEKTGPATAVPGESVEFTIEVGNGGRGPALEAMLTDLAPDGVTTDFDLGAIEAASVATRTTTFDVPADACPITLDTGATVTYKDIVGDRSTVTRPKTLTIVDPTPPMLTVSLSPAALSPPNHKLATITAAITVTDNCDPNPTVELLAINSSEPDNGLGDGDTANDIRSAALGTDDRSFSLRAERGGKGPGRIYTVIYRAVDRSGNASSTSAEVRVR